MQYCFRQDDLALRRMQNTFADCSLIYNWLCDDRVAEFYGGVSERKTWQQICEKYGGRAAQEEGVVPCIIEYDGDPIGYLQYYVTDPEEYDCGDYVDFSPFSHPMAIDLLIGVPTLWGKGLGSRLVRATCRWLVDALGADAVFIDPQLRNPRGIRCYEKAGFVPVSVVPQREEHDGVLQDSLIMRWEDDRVHD